MSDPSTRSDKVVAVINSNQDTVELLRDCLEHHGFRQVVTGHVREIREGATDFLEFVSRTDPAVFVYDISIPYDRNWRFLQLLLNTEVMKGRRLVLTTTNKKALDEMVGPNDALEIIGKPYDIDQIVSAVAQALGV
jgi:DNA-binding NtrC family response regulator